MMTMFGRRGACPGNVPVASLVMLPAGIALIYAYGVVGTMFAMIGTYTCLCWLFLRSYRAAAREEAVA